MAGSRSIDYTISRDAKLASTAFSTATSFSSLVPTTTEPTGNWVIDLAGKNQENVQQRDKEIPYNLALYFVGTNADNQTLTFRIYAWGKVQGGDLWFPVGPLVTGTATLSSTQNGVDGEDLTSSHYFADTIALNTNVGTVNVNHQVISSASEANDIAVAELLLDMRGYRKIQIDLNRNSSSASTNALYREL